MSAPEVRDQKSEVRNGFVRVDDLIIPDFASTEDSVAWGKEQRPERKRLICSVYKYLEQVALNTTDLQKKADYATQAQLLREAWESIPDSAIPIPNSAFA